MFDGSIAYDTATLIGVVPNLKKSQRWLQKKFFPSITQSETEYVAIDVDVGKRRMAPLVSPLVEGKLVEQRRLQTNGFKPAYIKDKRAPDLRKPIRRQYGERIGGGELTPAERMMANLQFEMEDQVDMVDRRIEWMCAQTLLEGGITLVGDGYEATYIDFGRDPTLTVTLSGSNMWGVTGNFNAGGKDPVPTKSLDVWAAQILKKSGAVVTDIVFTTSPWECFLNSVLAEGAIQYPKLGLNEINPGTQVTKGAMYKGRWGNFDLWLYNDWYVDVNDVEQPMIADGNIIMCGEDLLGVVAHAAILDPRLGYVAMPYAPKTWIQEDPAQQLMMMQSSPLAIPSRVNASFSAYVCTPSTFPV